MKILIFPKNDIYGPESVFSTYLLSFKSFWVCSSDFQALKQLCEAFHDHFWPKYKNMPIFTWKNGCFSAFWRSRVKICLSGSKKCFLRLGKQQNMFKLSQNKTVCVLTSPKSSWTIFCKNQFLSFFTLEKSNFPTLSLQKMV